MQPPSWFFSFCLLATSFASLHGAGDDRIQRIDDENILENALAGITPWAAILPLSGEGEYRQLVSFRPRLGREEEMLAESSRSPPFAPRLGRFYAPFSPRLGRQHF